MAGGGGVRTFKQIVRLIWEGDPSRRAKFLLMVDFHCCFFRLVKSQFCRNALYLNDSLVSNIRFSLDDNTGPW